ncbi:carbohydrate-binding protein [Pararhizobium sp. LjRoot238]|uniref:carbohydrate-binding protein n=1 Tax=Pararhizobium sp. LjRoot238 TaxID=3342293 RepID=UPI003F4FAED6
MTEAKSRALFRDPTHAFRPSAYWFWHSIPDAQTSRAQLTDFRDQGFGTILIQARIAFPRELYLSDAYLAAYRQAIEIAGELGLKAGIYDDYNWISGHAGGRTVDGRDDLRERHLFWSTAPETTGKISGIHPPFVNSMGREILRWHYEGGLARWCEWTIEAALLHPSGAMSDVHQAIDISARVRVADANALSCSFVFDGEVPAGQVITVFVSARSATSRHINYLLPEAAARFIEVGLEPYRRILGDLMPDPLGFVFYDQPAAGFYRWDQLAGNLGNSLLFAATLAPIAVEKAGAAFPYVLLSLLRDVGQETPRLRVQFYEVYSSLMNTSFFGTLRAWAVDCGIVLTGHEILPHISSWSLSGGFTSIDPRVAPATDFFGIDRFRHETAVDSNNFVAQLAPKLGDSVARSNGRSRCVVETYASATRTPVRAAGQWELTLETMRAQAIRLHCLGTRQFLWHGVYQTDGHDSDPTPFANPRFDYGPGINFEPWWAYHHLFAEESARISAFIEPATPHARVAILYPLHTAWAEGPRNSHATHIGAWCEHLLALGCDFMLVDEGDLSTASIDGRTIGLVGLAFDAVVMPSATVLNSTDTLHKLADFRAAGGMIWMSGNGVKSVCNGTFDGSDELGTVHLRDLPARSDIAELVARLPLVGPQIVAPAGQFLWRWVGRDADGWWRVVLFNDGMQSLECSITQGDGFDCEVWSATDGADGPIGAFGRLAVGLEPQQAKCLRLREADGQALGDNEFSSLPVWDPSRAMPLEDGWNFAGSDSDFAPISVRAGWEAQGRPDFSGTGIYRHSLEIASNDEWMLELGEVHTAVTVRLNGREVGQRAWRPYRFLLGRLPPGRYELELAVSNTAANRYYAGTSYQGEMLDKSGLTTPPRLIPLANTH